MAQIEHLKVGHRRVSRRNPTPLYAQVEQNMRQLIAAGEWSPGYRVPSEKDLEGIYGVSRITIRRALNDLAAEGMLVREPGRGTFVRRPTLVAEPKGVTSFTEEMVRLGFTARARVLHIGLEPPDSLTATRLNQREGEMVVVVHRLRLVDGEPFGIQRARLAARRFPGLERSDLTDRSLYTHLRGVYGVIPTEAEETFRVGQSVRSEARLLQVAPGACAFLVDRLTFDEEGPFEFTESIMRGDRYRVHLGLRSTNLARRQQ